MQISSLYYKLQISNYQLYLACCSVVPCQFVAYQEVYRKDDVQPTFRKQGTGTRKGGRTRGIKELPRAISHPRHKINIFITVACHASAPIMAKASLRSHLFFSFFVPSTHADSTTLTCFTLPHLFKASRFTSLRSTNNYRNSSNNYQHREIPRGGAEEEVPAGRPCPGNSTAPSSPPRSNPVTPRPAWSESLNNETQQMSTCDGEMAPNTKPQEYKNQGGQTTNRCRLSADP